MKNETAFLLKTLFIGAAAIIVVALVFFNIENFLMWMKLNNPFQGQFVVVQLSDGEILYGHLAGVSGSTIGLSDVYLLDKVSQEATSTARSDETVSSSTDLSITGSAAPATTAQQLVVPVSDTPELFINRASVVYFKFVTAADPALPYLH